jgi:hypothetical protein
MAPVAHFIVTRFNVRERSSDTIALDPEWLNGRFELFERFCLPTVRSQTEQAFRWLVLFDSDTPLDARERIARYQQWPNFVPLFLPPAVAGGARKAIISQLSETPDVLLTTRLDSDDGICRTFVEQLRQRATVREPTVLDFPIGYILHRDRTYRYRFPLNAFATLAEPVTASGLSGFRTVYTGSHVDLGHLGRIVEVTQKPSWLQVVHGGNLENRARGVREPRAHLRESFDLGRTLTFAPENALTLQVDRLYTLSLTVGYNIARSVYGVLSSWWNGFGAKARGS